MKTLLLLVIAVSTAYCKNNFPELESLYDSSNPDLPWPPAGTGFSGAHSNWPNQGQRFGKLWPRQKVTVLKKLADFSDFEKNYLSKSQPVVIEGMLKQMQSLSDTDLQADKLVKAGRAVITYIQVNASTAGGKSQRMSLREFLLNKDDDLFTRDHLPRYLKTELLIPTALKCHELLKGGNLYDTMHRYIREKFLPLPLRQEVNHQLYCQIDGEKEVLLIKESDFPTWRDMKTKEEPGYGRMGPFFDVSSIDFNANPQLKDIKLLHIASLKPGQCLFVPAGWIHQQNVMNTDHSLELRWKEQKEEYDCSKELYDKLTLGDLDWLGEGEGGKSIERSIDSRRKLWALQSHLVSKYLLKDDSRSLKAFVAALKKDDLVTESPREWNDECEVSAEELFKNLDRNGDDKLDEKDVEGLKEEELEFWMNVSEDRHQDFAELYFDMRVDGAGGGQASANEGMKISHESMMRTVEEMGLLRDEL